MKQEDLREQVALTDEFLGDISEAYWGYQGEDPYGPVRAIIGLLIPPGHVVVPVEPTREMLNAAPLAKTPVRKACTPRSTAPCSQQLPR